MNELDLDCPEVIHRIVLGLVFAAEEWRRALLCFGLVNQGTDAGSRGCFPYKSRFPR